MRAFVYPAQAEPVAASAQPGFWRRFTRAIIESRQRQVERQVALYLKHRFPETRSGAQAGDWKRAADALPF